MRQCLAGVEYANPGILEGLDSVPTILSASFLFLNTGSLGPDTADDFRKILSRAYIVSVSLEV